MTREGKMLFNMASRTKTFQKESKWGITSLSSLVHSIWFELLHFLKRFFFFIFTLLLLSRFLTLFTWNSLSFLHWSSLFPDHTEATSSESLPGGDSGNSRPVCKDTIRWPPQWMTLLLRFVPFYGGFSGVQTSQFLHMALPMDGYFGCF